MERTPAGTVSSKVSSDEISVSDIFVGEGESLVAGVGYQTGQGDPVLTWGQHELDVLVKRENSSRACGLWLLPRAKRVASRIVLAKWGGNITAKVMFISRLSGAKMLDVFADNTNTTTTDPTTGPAVQTVERHTINIAAFVSRGPSGDDAGTVGSGHTPGQRIGTVGAAPNVTIQETFELLKKPELNCRAVITGATSRNWVNVIVALSPKRKSYAGFQTTRMIADETGMPVLTTVAHRFERIDGTLVAVKMK